MNVKKEELEKLMCYAMRELGRGRLLFYVSFEKSDAYLDAVSLNELVGYNLI